MKKLMLLIPFILLLSLISVNAGFNCGYQTPSNSGTLGNQTTLNISFADEGNLTSVGVMFTASSSITQNSSASIILNSTNSTLTSGATNFINISFPDSVILQEANNYILDCTCYNSSTSVSCNSTRTNILIDRIDPTPATSITYTNPVQDADTITATVDRTNTNRCYIKFGGNSLTTMTLSGSTCTYTAQRGIQTPPDGDYKFIIRTDDRTNTSDTVESYVTIDHDQSDGGGLFGGTVVASSDGIGQSSIGISSNPFSSKKVDSKVIAIILLVVVFLYFKNQK